MALKECQNCKAEIVFYSNEVTTCPHCSHRHFLGSGDKTIKPKSNSDLRISDLPKNTSGISDKSFWATLFFFFFLTGLGAHRLYVGKIYSGLFYPFSILSTIVWIFLTDSDQILLNAAYGLVGLCCIFLLIYDLFSIILSKFTDSEGNVVTTDSDLSIPAIIQTNIGSKNLERDVAQEIKKFSELKDQGIISEEEFYKKKQELLNQ